MRQNQAKGFSLVEIILVLVLGAMLLALSLPRMNQAYEGYYLRKIKDDLLLKSRYAKHMAAASSSTYMLEVMDDRRSYVMKRSSVSRNSEGVGFGQIPGVMGRPTKLEQQVQIKSSVDKIFFYPDGSMTGADIEIQSPHTTIRLSSHYVLGGFIVIGDEHEK